MHSFCPSCFAEIGANDHVCAACGTEVERWDREHTFTERLIHALHHPSADARIAAIVVLGNRGDPQAAVPLAKCALRHPTDVVQALEIVRSIARLAESPERREALRRLTEHPARHVRTAARGAASASCGGS
jgi:HEAT repeat protein